MKRIILKATMAFATIILAASCAKQGVSWFTGNYTFKTSGTISVCAETDDEDTESEPSEIALTTESGQMDIITVNKGDGSMIVTMNVVGGEIIVFDATATGKELILEPASRKISINLSGISSEIRLTTEVTVSGDAYRYDNTIIFYLNYEGSYTQLGTTYNIVGSSVKCVAKLN